MLGSPTDLTGLLLTGGGARAAYQVGVLKAIGELLPDDGPTPFPIICGTSAGAINAAVLATEAGHFKRGVATLERVWSNMRCEQVFRTAPRLAAKSALLWTLSLLFGGIGRYTPRSLLDNAPLRLLLEAHVDPVRIQRWIDDGRLHAFSLTAAAYNSGHSTTFFQGHTSIPPWKRTRRIGVPRPLTIDHILASAAIPFLFPAVRIGYDYYGDGSMRQLAPLSCALHLGASRLLAIGARNEMPDDPDRPPVAYLEHPSPGQIASFILDTIFMDGLSTDIERLRRINHTLQYVPSTVRSRQALRTIELMTVFPSEDVRPLAERHAGDFPRSVHYLLRSIGATRGRGRPLISYLLFEQGFCRELIALGYRDACSDYPRLRRLLGLRAPAEVSRETPRDAPRLG